MTRTATLLLLAAVLAACSGDDGGFVYRGDLGDLGAAPEFHLLERAGTPLDTKDLLGKVWITAFIFTRCQKECGQMGIEMAELQEEFEKEPDFRMLSVTVDPAHDKPEILKTYAKGWDAHPERWLFAWGRAEDIKAVMNGFGVGWQDRMVNHSTYFVLVDRKGRRRGMYDGLQGERMRKLRQDIRTLLAE